jgi:hypothetical protein
LPFSTVSIFILFNFILFFRNETGVFIACNV